MNVHERQKLEFETSLPRRSKSTLLVRCSHQIIKKREESPTNRPIDNRKFDFDATVSEKIAAYQPVSGAEDRSQPMENFPNQELNHQIAAPTTLQDVGTHCQTHPNAPSDATSILKYGEPSSSSGGAPQVTGNQRTLADLQDAPSVIDQSTSRPPTPMAILKLPSPNRLVSLLL